MNSTPKELTETVRKAHEEAHELADNPEYGGDPIEVIVTQIIEYALSDESVERAAAKLHDDQWVNSPWHPKWGEGHHAESDTGHRQEWIGYARNALSASLQTPPAGK